MIINVSLNNNMANVSPAVPTEMRTTIKYLKKENNNKAATTTTTAALEPPPDVTTETKQQ